MLLETRGYPQVKAEPGKVSPLKNLIQEHINHKLQDTLENRIVGLVRGREPSLAR
jgi:hypothetical protein